MGSPLIRIIPLSALTPIPAPLAEIIQAYAESDLALPIQSDESSENEAKTPQKREFVGFPSKSPQRVRPFHDTKIRDKEYKLGQKYVSKVDKP